MSARLRRQNTARLGPRLVDAADRQIRLRRSQLCKPHGIARIETLGGLWQNARLTDNAVQSVRTYPKLCLAHAFFYNAIFDNAN
jgi:hypothetical protein